MPRTKSALSAAEPSAACLRFSFDPNLLGESAAASIAAHYKTCVAFEERWNDLTDRRQTLLEQARDCTYGVLCDTAAELVAERVGLQAQLDQMFAARRALCESLLGSAAVAVAQAERSHDAVLASIRQELAEKGIDASAMPAGGPNPRAAERQLEFRISTDDRATASLGRRRRVESAAGELAAVAETPESTTVQLTWPGVSRDAERLAEFLGLTSDNTLYALRLGGGRFA